MGNDLSREMEKFFSVFDQLFDQAGAVVSSTSYSVPSYPPTDVYVKEDTKDWVYEFAMAFFNEEDISIEFSGDWMYIKATRKQEDDANKRFVHKGVRSSSIENRYYVPIAKFDTEKVEATFKDGVLKVVVPVKPEIKPKKINITK